MKFLLPLLLLTGCVWVFPDHMTHYPVELPNNISGMYIQCSSDLECEHNSVGVCNNGYWIAKEIIEAQFPHGKMGEIIVCRKAPTTYDK